MNIYIYGTKNFKNMINEELKRSHIDYKLGDKGLIQEISSLEALKELIEDNPDEVYLIDDSKIIKENIVNSKIKFLKPKDGIEQQYLKDMGIEELSVDSVSDISKHIFKKMKLLGIDEEDDFIERDEIESTISNIVKNAYDEDENLDQSEEKYELSDDLKSLLTSSKEDFLDENLLENSLQNEDLIPNKEIKMENKKPSEIFSLDELTENDIMAAFGGTLESVSADNINCDSSSKEVSITLSSKEEIQDFLTKLLNSKALEITVKVKE